MTFPPRLKPARRAAALAVLSLAWFFPPGAARGQSGPAGLPALGRAERAWVKKTLKELTLREKVAQLIKVRVMGRFLNRQSEEFRNLEREVRANGVGGVVLFAGSIYESAVLLNRLQSMSKLPLLVSADFERGAAFRIADTTSFPWTMAIGATGSEEFARREGAVTAREARALGVHWLFAPVMDVNNNPDNPVINIRSFGEDPELVARLGAAFIRGARENGALTTAKHFPGHGDTATDSHIGLAVVPSDAARLDAVELVPFRSAVKAGVDSIMTAHVAVPQLTGEADTPATLSAGILTGLLRESLDFRGLIVTDALEMGGITTRVWAGQAAVRALSAGADMLLLPPDAGVALDEVVRAVGRGELTEARIDRSVERVLEAKARLGLHRQRIANLARIADVVAAPDSLELARAIAERSVTLVKDTGRLLPLHPLHPPRILSLVLSADLDPAPAPVFQTELRRRFPSARTAVLDPRISEEALAGVENSAAQADVVVCSTVVRVVTGSGTVGLPDRQRALIERLIASGKPVLWVAFGNPYLLRYFPQVAAYLCTYSYADVSQAAAARALSGEIEISGRLPVSIPGQARAGEGLSVPRLDLTLKPAAPESVGLPPTAFDETRQILASSIEQKAFPGGALAVGFRGRLVLEAAVGNLEYDPRSPAVTPDTIYDLASLTKAVATTSAAMVLADAGRLLFTARVQDYLPEFRGENKEKVTVLHLLNHSAGLPAFVPFYKEAKGHAAMLKRVLETPLDYEPGARSRYSDLGMMLMGEILARASGRTQDRFASERLFQPLAMKSTMFKPPAALRQRIAPTENDPWRGRVVRGEVHDENAFAFGGVAGHAGLFSSLRDLEVFAQMLLNRGLYDHRRLIEAETVARFTTLQSAPEQGRAIGWGKPVPNAWSGKIFSPAAFGHTGFTGTMIWIDPERELFLILLTNRVHPSRANQNFDRAREAIAEAVVRAVTPPPPTGSF